MVLTISHVPGTTPHCLVNTERNVNILRTRSLVYWAPRIELTFHKGPQEILTLMLVVTILANTK